MKWVGCTNWEESLKSSKSNFGHFPPSSPFRKFLRDSLKSVLVRESMVGTSSPMDLAAHPVLSRGRLKSRWQRCWERVSWPWPFLYQPAGQDEPFSGVLWDGVVEGTFTHSDRSVRISQSLICCHYHCGGSGKGLSINHIYGTRYSIVFFNSLSLLSLMATQMFCGGLGHIDQASCLIV